MCNDDSIDNLRNWNSRYEKRWCYFVLHCTCDVVL